LKEIIRKQVLAARDAMPPDERKAKEPGDRRSPFFSSGIHVRARHPVLRLLPKRGGHAPDDPARVDRRQTVILPKVRGGNLGLFEIRNFATDVSPGAWGIPEPREVNPVRLDEIDIVLVPGAALMSAATGSGMARIL